MTGTKRLFGWLIACAFVVAGAGVAQADGGHWKHKLAGEWNNASTGENMKIVRGSVGWEVWLSNSGEARLTANSDDGSNVQISGKGLSCSYYLTAGVRKAVGIRGGAISGNIKVSFQAARSIG